MCGGLSFVATHAFGAFRGSGVVWRVSRWVGLGLRWFVRFVCLSRER